MLSTIILDEINHLEFIINSMNVFVELYLTETFIGVCICYFLLLEMYLLYLVDFVCLVLFFDGVIFSFFNFVLASFHNVL